MSGITHVGLTNIISTCKETLAMLEMALCDQAGLTGQFCAALCGCLNLEYIDMSGSFNVGDEGIGILKNGEIE